MKKTKRWRQARGQKRTRKLRAHRETKPDAEARRFYRDENGRIVAVTKRDLLAARERARGRPAHYESMMDDLSEGSS